MKNERILNNLGQVNDEYIAEAAPVKKENNKYSWLTKVVMVACLCLAITGGILYNALKPQDFSSMMAGTVIDTHSVMTYIGVGNRTACYEQVSIDSSKLEKYVGTLYQQTDNTKWLYPAGVDNLKYLIRQSDTGELSLWVFDSFVVSEGDTYTYGEVMKTIYGVDGPEDIMSITTTPSKGNNTDFGKSIQNEIGTHTYTDTEDIAVFYDIVVDVKCLGADSESVGDSNRFTYSFSTDAQDKLTSGESTYATRVLSVALADGTTIDSWKYNALQGSFFEYGGLFTELLTDEAVYALNEMFGIK